MQQLPYQTCRKKVVSMFLLSLIEILCPGSVVLLMDHAQKKESKFCIWNQNLRMDNI